MRWMVLAGTVLLAGCATSPEMIQGNEESVVFKRAFDRAEASERAEAHCQEHGRAAKLVEVRDFFMTFECVESN